MAQLIVRNVTLQIVLALKQRAAANGGSAEDEHRKILHKTLLAGTGDFISRARELRNRLRSSVDSTETIRSHRERDSAA